MPQSHSYPGGRAARPRGISASAFLTLMIAQAFSAGCDTGPQAINLANCRSVEWNAHQPGVPDRVFKLVAGSDFEKLLREILSDQDRRWRPTLVTYAPVIRCRADDGTWDLNIVGESVVLNSSVRGRSRQVISKITQDQHRRLVKALEKLPEHDKAAATNRPHGKIRNPLPSRPTICHAHLPRGGNETPRFHHARNGRNPIETNATIPA